MLPEPTRTELLNKARAEGKTRILARVSWLRATCATDELDARLPYGFVAGRIAMKLECPDCVAVFAVNDWDINADWVVV